MPDTATQGPPGSGAPSSTGGGTNSPPLPSPPPPSLFLSPDDQFNGTIISVIPARHGSDPQDLMPVRPGPGDHLRAGYNQFRDLAVGQGTQLLQDATRTTLSAADSTWDWLKDKGKELGQVIAEPVYGAADRAQSVYDAIFGSPNSAAQKTWFFPLALLAAGGGAYLVYRLISDALQRRREEELREELEEAESEYEAALMSQFEKGKVEKKSSQRVSPRHQALVHFFRKHDTALEKYARFFEDLGREYRDELLRVAEDESGSVPSVSGSPDTLEKSAGIARSVLGAYLALASLLAAGSGWLTYTLLNKRRPETIFKQFARQRAAQTDYFGLGRRYSYEPVEFEVRPSRRDSQEKLVARNLERSPYTGFDNLDSITAESDLGSGDGALATPLVGEVASGSGSPESEETSGKMRSKSKAKTRTRTKKKTSGSSFWPFS